jgi:hypothetical protein
MDPGFLEKINGRFLCLTTAILCHALRCWRTGVFTDKVNFTRANSQGKSPVFRVHGGNLVVD